MDCRTGGVPKRYMHPHIPWAAHCCTCSWREPLRLLARLSSRGLAFPYSRRPAGNGLLLSIRITFTTSIELKRLHVNSPWPCCTDWSHFEPPDGPPAQPPKGSRCEDPFLGGFVHRVPWPGKKKVKVHFLLQGTPRDSFDLKNNLFLAVVLGFLVPKLGFQCQAILHYLSSIALFPIDILPFKTMQIKWKKKNAWGPVPICQTNLLEFYRWTEAMPHRKSWSSNRAGSVFFRSSGSFKSNSRRSSNRCWVWRKTSMSLATSFLFC